MAADKANADVLGRWVGGTWPLEGKMLDTEFSKVLTVTGVSNCGWSPDHVFMICDQSLLEDGKPSRELSAYVFDPDKGTFHFYGLSPEGGRPHSSDVVDQRGRKPLGVSEQNGDQGEDCAVSHDQRVANAGLHRVVVGVLER